MEELNIAKISNIYQFKITLKYIKPKIWRRIQVPEEYSFKDLHLAIQDAMMGWKNYHLHQFKIINPKTGQKDLIVMPDDEHEDFPFCDPIIPEDEVKIANYFLTPKNKAIYEYDFGDGWEHEVMLEKILPAVVGANYPKCIDGKRACPPEDCGGVWGYKDLLKKIANPYHKEYEECMEWLRNMRGDFNPEEFDPRLVEFGDHISKIMGQLNIAKISNIYQFKITLKYIKPKIWRRIQVPEKYSFKDLHLAIQDAMGWEKYHLHQFQMINPETGQKDLIGMSNNEGFSFCDPIPENKVKITKYFLTPKNKAIYEYDFGDGWQHEVMLEKILPAVVGANYPKCIDGKRACPPEDCGGVWGYKGLLEIIANPYHEKYKECMEWLRNMRGDFNPEEFDPRLVEFGDHFSKTRRQLNIAKISNIYQFKITLKYSKPKIWRRIQVPEKYNFKDLHLAIQDAMMGWVNYHLHQFHIINPKTGQKDLIGMPDDEGFPFCEPTIPEDDVKIAKYFLTPKDKAIYEYDFGDGWEHEIMLEKILPAVVGADYPQCIDGKRACPPEDCGGVWGYKELLEIIANPNHKEYKERMEWLRMMRGNFNPEEFDPRLVKFGTVKHIV